MCEQCQTKTKSKSSDKQKHRKSKSCGCKTVSLASASVSATALAVADKEALGNTAKFSSDFPANHKKPFYDHRIARAERYRVQSIIADLLIREGQKAQLKYADDFHKTAQCLRKPYASSVGVNKSAAHNVAFYTGTQRCGSPWGCPVCSAQIQEVRRVEIAQAFDFTYKSMTGKKVIMVTFTFPHKLHDRLKVQLDKLSNAFKSLRGGEAYQKMKTRFGYVGLIRSLEIMHGNSGWHSHTHEAWIVNKDADIEELRKWLLKRWWDVCVKVGLIEATYAKTNSFADHAVQITDNCKSSDYLAKQGEGHWGADRELAKANSKGTRHSDKKTIHPFDLIRKLEDDGDAKYADLFVEYVIASKGEKQIYWSPGLKKLVGLKDRKDEEIIEDGEDKSVLLASLTREDWRLVVRKKVRTELLDVAEIDGFEGIVKFLEVLRE